MVFFTVTTCVWWLYFLYLSVLLAGKCHPRADVGYMLHYHVDGEISPRYDYRPNWTPLSPITITNCALGPSKSIRYSGDFVIVGFVIAGFVSTYFTVILPGFQCRSLQRGLRYSGCHCKSLVFIIKKAKIIITLIQTKKQASPLDLSFEI